MVAAPPSTVLRESFDSGDTFSRTVEGRPAEACEAARRTLLSQGYAIARADDAQVEGNKNFQPREDDHEQLVLRISCAPRGGQALVFVSAVQDRYALKKSPTSASVGVGALLVSLPFGSNDDSLVKVASSTVTDAEFYRRFFQRLQRIFPLRAGLAIAITGHSAGTRTGGDGPGLSVRGRWLSVALLLVPSWVVAAPSLDCAQGLLQRLGWRFEDAVVSAPQVHGGAVCTRASLAAAQAAGDLQVRWPAALAPTARQALLQLLDDPATVCAYAFELGAARRATEALEGNPGFRFSGLQLGWIGFGVRGAPAQGGSARAASAVASCPVRATAAHWRRSIAGPCVPNAVSVARLRSWPPARAVR